MRKIEVEHKEVVGDLTCEYKVTYEFEGKPDYEVLSFMPCIVNDMIGGEDDQ